MIQQKHSCESYVMNHELRFVTSYTTEVSLTLTLTLTELKTGDTVTLVQKLDKNEPKAAWTVVKVNFQKRQAKVVRDSGMDCQRGSQRWICFSRIDQIFPREHGIMPQPQP